VQLVVYSITTPCKPANFVLPWLNLKTIFEYNSLKNPKLIEKYCKKIVNPDGIPVRTVSRFAKDQDKEAFEGRHYPGKR
jgi:hypothetical protein